MSYEVMPYRSRGADNGSSSSSARPGGSSGGGRDGDKPPPPGWDAPPSGKPPPGPAENETTMLLVHRVQLSSASRREVVRVAFSPGDRHIATLAGLQMSEHSGLVSLWNYGPQGFARVQTQDIKCTGNFVFAPLPDAALVCPYRTFHPDHADWQPDRAAIATHDLLKRRKRGKTDTCPVRAPLAYSPDGALIAGVSELDARRVLVLNAGTFTVARVFPQHTEDVTHVAFMPDGSAVVSLARDGFTRITSLASGKTVGKFEISTRHSPSLLAVSPRGKGVVVASVWGREVTLWHPDSGEISGYNLDTARREEGWPVAISPDCQLLACRTESGFDVCDLATGKFRGNVVDERSFVTAAAFSSDNRWLAVGKHSGELQLYDIVTQDVT